MRYQAPFGAEAECQPGSRGRVLQNLLGITRKRDMDLAEYKALLAAQEAELSIVTARTRFTTVHLCRMHNDWLGGIYEWAGRYRTVELSKDGFAWPPAFRVAENMAAFESGLLREFDAAPARRHSGYCFSDSAGPRGVSAHSSVSRGQRAHGPLAVRSDGATGGVARS